MRERIHYLDSARGLAALSVVASHFRGLFALPSGYEFLSNTPFHIFFHGSGAVRFFFVLSGYILSRILVNHIADINAATMLRYITSRVFRIYPLFIITLLITVALLLNFKPELQELRTQYSWLNDFWQEEITLRRIVKESLLVIDIANSSKRIVTQDWSLSFEVLISILIPFLLVLVKRTNPITILIFTFISIKFLGLNGFCFDFTLGILIMENQKKLEELWGKSSLFIKIFILILSIILYTSEFIIDRTIVHFLQNFLLNLTSIGCALFLVTIINSAKTKRILELNPLVFIGNVSYGIYLTHMLVLVGFATFFSKILLNMGIADGWLSLIINFSLSCILIILLSYILNKTVELPFIKAGKKLITKFNL